MSIQNCQPITEHQFEFVDPENEAFQNGGAEQGNNIINLHITVYCFSRKKCGVPAGMVLVCSLNGLSI